MVQRGGAVRVAVRWCSVVVQCGYVLVRWCSIVVQCGGAVRFALWRCFNEGGMLVQCGGAVRWCNVMVQCGGECGGAHVKSYIVLDTIHNRNCNKKTCCDNIMK